MAVSKGVAIFAACFLRINPAFEAVALGKGEAMSDDKRRALPRNTLEYHARQAARLRALVATTPTTRLKAQLSEKAEQQEWLAGEELEALNTPAV
jgi:hypothetical protein